MMAFFIMRIAFQGEPGAYSEAAALRFSSHAETLPCESFEQVFEAVQTGKTTFGILPIENSIGGSIHRNYDLLLEHELPVVAEVLLQVSHNLLAFPGTKMADIKKVYSHPQGLAQCEGFLSSLKGVEIVATYDTAGSAKMIRDQQKLGLGMIYKGFAQRANLPAEKAEELSNLLADHVMTNINHITAVLREGKSPQEMDKIFAEQEQETNEQVKQLLGAETYAKYVEYNRDLASYLTSEQFKTRLPGDAATKDAQAKQLFELMQQETQTYQRHTQGAAPWL